MHNKSRWGYKKNIVLNATADYSSENILFNNVSLDKTTTNENIIKDYETKKRVMAKL